MMTSLAILLLVQTPRYDPLYVSSKKIETVLETWTDQARGRDVPVRLGLPSDKEPHPVVIFSHGLGGSRMNNTTLLEHWARRGYVAVWIQHLGSDEGVWRTAPRRDAMQAMQKAASGQNLQLRLADVAFVVSELKTRSDQKDHVLGLRIDTEKIGMSGHSFGAVTTQGVSGQSFPGVGARFTLPEIKAAVMFSPSPPAVGDPATAFGSVRIPWLLMTGTKDESPIGNKSPEDRLRVFPAVGTTEKYQLVLKDGTHGAFNDRSRERGAGSRNPNHFRLTLALSTAFWDAYLKGDSKAVEWLKGDGARSLLEPGDLWEIGR
ncbi:MAG: dienelactone hydrolase family protein [Fimbriimonadaceae bacterium]|jgi:predicted dienelactone hydrolase|nr:dienelactone hydrolase family protein [Fimbriimonadaceae bacterium]